MDARRTIAVCALAMIGLTAHSKTCAAEWRFPLGMDFNSGYFEVVDYYEDRIGAETSFIWPVGLSFGPYVQMDHGSMIGIDFGPASYIVMEVTYYGGYSGSSSEDYQYFGLPIGAYYGFAFMPRFNVSPYAKVGVKYHIAVGDGPESSTPGPFVAFGVEFMRKRMVGIGFQLSYDAAEVEFESTGNPYGGYVEGEKIQPGKFGASFRVVF